MNFIFSPFKKINILVLWPCLSFLLLHVLAILAWDCPCLIHTLLLSVVAILLLSLHIYFKKLLFFIFFIALSVSSLGLNYWQTTHLSRNITDKAIGYRALVLEDGGFENGLTTVRLGLKTRLEPLPADVSGTIQLKAMGHCDWSKGSELEFVASIKEPEAYQNPGVFSYDRYLRRQNIQGVTFIEDCKTIQLVNSVPRTGFSKWRHQLIENIANPQIENADILQALLLGTNTIDKDKNEKIRIAGLSHLFVISGLQFALMSAMVFFAFQKFFNFFPQIFLKIPRQKLCSAVTLLFVVFYTGLINHHPSVMRAGLTIAFYLFATILEKQKHLIHVVLLSMTVSLLLYPMDIFHLGFQMSYLCVLTLMMIVPRQWQWIQDRRIFKNASPRVLTMVKMVWVTWLLNLILVPLILHDFGEVSLNGLIQNLWAIPYFEFLVTPVGFVYLLTALLNLRMAPYILIFWDGTLRLFWLLFAYFEEFSLPLIRGFAPHTIHLWIFYVGLFLFFYFRRRWIIKTSAILLLITLGSTLYQNHYSYDFRITQIDVGQGDSLLVQTRNKNYLIDAGGHTFRDIGKMVILPVLNYLWVDDLDVVMLTHGDQDHYKGLTYLVGVVDIHEVWVNDWTQDDEEYQLLLEKLKAQKTQIVVWTQPKSWIEEDGLEIEVLSPHMKTALLQNKNDHSLVVKMKKNQFSALFTGDISETVEKYLIENYGDHLKSDFLKVAHHGSQTSSSRLFLSYVQPTYAGIGVKKKSPFGHPHADVLNRLKEYNAQILRTDEDGQIQIALKGDDVTVKKYNSTSLN